MVKSLIQKRIPFDERGSAAVEFALIAPVMFAVIMAIMDISHTMYVSSILNGAMQNAGRASALETGNGVTKQTTIDNIVTNAVIDLNNTAKVTFTRKSFESYRRVSVRSEDYTDTNSDGRCNNGEAFTDSNRNGKWDLDAGVAGQGGAKDAVLYTATMKYPRMFPVMGLLGWSNNVTVSSSTILKNQPFNDQDSAKAGICT
jgi:Flp pilus assembly protein TadG